MTKNELVADEVSFVFARKMHPLLLFLGIMYSLLNCYPSEYAAKEIVVHNSKKLLRVFAGKLQLLL